MLPGRILDGEEDPQQKDLWEKIQKHRKRSELWDRAAKEHLQPIPDSDIDLARREKVWRDLERSHPDWRELWKEAERDIQRLRQLKSESERLEESKRQIESKLAEGLTYEEIGNQLLFQNRLKVAAALDERIKKARLAKDHVFIRRFAKALTLPDDISRLPRSAKGFVLMAWAELGGLKFGGSLPTKAGLRHWVEICRKKDRLPPYNQKTWDRTWEDPFIAAFLRD